MAEQQWTPPDQPDTDWTPPETPDDQLTSEAVAPEASKHLADYRAGEGQHLLPQDASALDAFNYLRQQETEAMQGKTSTERQIDAAKALPGQIGKAWEGAKNWIGSLFQPTAPKKEGPAYESGLDYQSAKTGKPTPQGADEFLSQFSKELGAGPAFAKMVGALSDMGAHAINQNIVGPGVTQVAEQIPAVRPWIQHLQAANSAAADFLNGRIAETTKELAPKIGLDENSTGAMLADFIPWFANIPGMEMNSAEGIAKAVNAAARSMELAKVKAASGIMTVAPAASKLTKAVGGVAGAEALRAMGVNIPHGVMDIGGAVAGMMLPEKIFKSQPIADRVAAAMLNVPVEDVPWYLKAAKDVTPNLEINDAMANAMESSAAKKTAAAQDALADLAPLENGKPQLVERKAADGTWLHDTDKLPAAQRAIRTNFDEAEALQKRAALVRKRSDSEKVLSDIKTLLANSAVHTLQGAAIGSGFQEVTSPTGAPEGGEGALLGAFLSAPLSPVAGYAGMQTNRLAAAARALIEKGSKIIDPAQLEGLNTGQREYAQKMAAMAEPLGARMEIVTPDEMRARKGIPQDQPAPFGVYNPTEKTILVNRQTLGAAGHEIVHPMQQLFGQILGDTDPDLMKAFEDRYTKLNNGKPPFDSAQEREAEVGRVLMEQAPPEAFYGGKRGFDILKDTLRRWTQGTEVKVDPILNAPYSPQDINAMREKFFQVGEMAAAPKGPTTQIPDLGNAPTTQPAPPSPTVSPAHDIAIEALKATGIKPKDAEARVMAAAQDLQAAGQPVDLDGLMRGAFKRSIPQRSEVGVPAQNIPNVTAEPAPPDISEVPGIAKEGQPGFYMPGSDELQNKANELEQQATELGQAGEFEKAAGLRREVARLRNQADVQDMPDHPNDYEQLMPSVREPAIQLSNGMVLTGENAEAEAVKYGLDTEGAVKGFTGDKGRFIPGDMVDEGGGYDAEELYNRTGQYMPAAEPGTAGVDPLGGVTREREPAVVGNVNLPVEGLGPPEQYVGEGHGLEPARFVMDAPGSDVTTPVDSYAAGTRKPDNGNVWVRQSSEPDNSNRVLMVQFTPDLQYPDGPDPITTPYFDKLYSGVRPGYSRSPDFWEIPQWQAVVSHNLGGRADGYYVSNMDEAKAFMRKAGYGHTAFSVMDVSEHLTRDLAPHIPGELHLGGYTDRAAIAAEHPNAKIYNNMNEFVEGMGYPYRKGFDYRLFRGTETIPRLEMSAGCRHRCTFCTIDRQLTESPLSEIDQQVDSFKDMNAKLVYLNDKTFGQASNYKELPRLYNEMRQANPEFAGFVIQTTAAQMKIMPEEFLKNSGIKYIEIGVETYNDPILKSLRKPATEKLIDEAVEKMKRVGVNFVPNIVIGFPGETAETYARTMDFLRKNEDEISHVNSYNLAVYQGTEISKSVKSITAADADENSPTKSFYGNSKIHEDFSRELHDFASKRLDRPQQFMPGSDEVDLPDSDKLIWNLYQNATRFVQGNKLVQDRLKGLPEAERAERESALADFIAQKAEADSVGVRQLYGKNVPNDSVISEHTGFDPNEVDVLADGFQSSHDVPALWKDIQTGGGEQFMPNVGQMWDALPEGNKSDLESIRGLTEGAASQPFRKLSPEDQQKIANWFPQDQHMPGSDEDLIKTLPRKYREFSLKNGKSITLKNPQEASVLGSKVWTGLSVNKEGQLIEKGGVSQRHIIDQETIKSHRPLYVSRKYGSLEAEGQGEQNMPGFYSKLETELQAKLPDRATSDQIRGTIRGAGIKKAEIEWNTPLADLLDRPGPHSKQSVLIAARLGAPKVEVTPLNENAGSFSEQKLADAIEKHGNYDEDTSIDIARKIVGELGATDWTREQMEESLSYYAGIKDDLASHIAEQMAASNAVSQTQYGEHVLRTPGGSNYREILFHLGKDEPKEVMPRPLVVTSQGKDQYGLDPSKKWWLLDGDDGSLAFIREGDDGKFYVPDPQVPDKEFSSLDDATKFAVLQHRQLTGEPFLRGAGQPAYASPHFTHEAANLLGHLRLTDEKLPDGRNMTFVQEAQSDWAQDIREKGIKRRVPIQFKPNGDQPDTWDSINAYPGMYRIVKYGEGNFKVLGQDASRNPYPPTGSTLVPFPTLEEAIASVPQEGMASQITELPEGFEVRKSRARIPVPGEFYQVYDANGVTMGTPGTGATKEAAVRGAINEINRKTHLEQGQGVSDMPFKGEAWKRLLLRQAIKEAVDAGHDSIGWTTGDQQNKRYNLEEHVSAIRWDDGKHVDIPSTEGSKKISIIVKGGDDVVLFADKDGVITSSDFRHGGHAQFEGRSLSDVIGAGHAKKIMSENRGTLTGEGLSLGGHGMKGFYDKELVNIANDIGKKYSAKVRDAEIDTGENPNPTLTMKAIIRAGETKGFGFIRPNGQWLSKIDPDGTYRFADISSHAKVFPDMDAAGEFQKQNINPKTMEKIHELPITDALRKEVSERGQPMFMPAATEAGKKMEAGGLKFRIDRDLSLSTSGDYNALRVFKQGKQIARADFVIKGPVASLLMINVSPEYQNQGLGQVMYRELGKHLQDQGVEDLHGTIVSTAAKKIREKLFPDTDYEDKGFNAWGAPVTNAMSRISPNAQFMPPTVNIGLDVGDKRRANSPEKTLRALEAAGAIVQNHSVHTAPTGEQTLVATMREPLDDAAATKVSSDLNQEAIAQWDGQSGDLHGPGAEAWRPFNPDFFIDHDGQPLSSYPDQSQSRPDREAAMQRQVMREHARLPASPPSAAGLWDRGTVDPNTSVNIPDIAEELGVPEDKRFFEQRPDAQQKIIDHFKDTGEAQYMPGGKIHWSEPETEVSDKGREYTTGIESADGRFSIDGNYYDRDVPQDYTLLDTRSGDKRIFDTVAQARKAAEEWLSNPPKPASARVRTPQEKEQTIRFEYEHSSGRIKDQIARKAGREGIDLTQPQQFMPGQRTWDQVAAHLDDEELASFKDNYKQKIIDSFKKLSLQKGLEYAKRGAAGKNWYTDSVDAIRDLFASDIPERRSDPDRFAGLLAALSPNRAVSSDLTHSLQAWAEWERLGRPQDRATIEDIIARTNVKSGEKETANMPAYLANAFRVLTATDPSKVKLSGPKVDPFFANLRGDMNKVTNDRHMGFYGYGNVNFGARSAKQPGEPGKRRLIQTHKGIAMTAHVRQIAKRLSEISGETWTPAEVQAAIWTYQLPLQDVAKAMGTTTKQLLKDGFQLSQKELDKVPSFASLLHHEVNQKPVRTIRSRRGHPIPEIGRGATDRPQGGEIAPEVSGAGIPDLAGDPF